MYARGHDGGWSRRTKTSCCSQTGTQQSARSQRTVRRRVVEPPRRLRHQRVVHVGREHHRQVRHELCIHPRGRAGGCAAHQRPKNLLRQVAGQHDLGGWGSERSTQHGARSISSEQMVGDGPYRVYGCRRTEARRTLTNSIRVHQASSKHQKRHAGMMGHPEHPICSCRTHLTALCRRVAVPCCTVDQRAKVVGAPAATCGAEGLQKAAKSGTQRVSTFPPPIKIWQPTFEPTVWNRHPVTTAVSFVPVVFQGSEQRHPPSWNDLLEAANPCASGSLTLWWSGGRPLWARPGTAPS